MLGGFWPWSASGVRGSHGSPVFDTELDPWRQARVVVCDVPGEQPALVVVPAELLQVLFSWQRWARGLEGLAFNQVALGVQRRVPGRGSLRWFRPSSFVVGQVSAAPAIEAL